MKAVIIDNYDSFTYNLYHLIRETGTDTTVLRNDAFNLKDIEAYDKIILSPGPGIPEEAVKVLGLLYNDEEVLNVILYGVEGLHYEVEEDGSFSFPDGVTENNVGYTCSVKWQFNTPKAGIWSGMSEDLEKDFAEFEASAEVSPAYGFWLDESKITVDMQKIRAIVSEYRKFQNAGMTEDGQSMEAYLEEFRQKLREAGSEQLVKEVSKQYQAWKKEKEGQKAGK